MIEAARAAAAAVSGLPSTGQQNYGGGVAGLHPAFSTLTVPGALYPEIALFSQFGQLFPQYVENNAGQQSAQAQNQQQVSQQPSGGTNPLLLQPKPISSEEQMPTGSRAGGRTRSSDSRSSSAYASRHQAAEQRRRTRINERLELLRKMVPHAERANTACFLEEVIKYIDTLKRRTTELESALQAYKSSKTATPPDADNNASSPRPSPPPPPLFASTLATLGKDGAAVDASQGLLSSVPAKSPVYFTFNEDAFAVKDALKASGEGAAPGTPPPQANAAQADNNPNTLDLRKPRSISPVSSEESGVPLKKRKCVGLVL